MVNSEIAATNDRKEVRALSELCYETDEEIKKFYFTDDGELTDDPEYAAQVHALYRESAIEKLERKYWWLPMAISCVALAVVILRGLIN